MNIRSGKIGDRRPAIQILIIEEYKIWKYFLDIVFFDMNRDGFTDCASIISDSTTRDGIPKIIYNYIEPGYTVEEDIIKERTVMGHYRYPDPG